MRIRIKNQYEFHHELRARPEVEGIPLSTVNVTQDLAALVDEAYTRSVLAEQLPVCADELHVEIDPEWSTEPAVDKIGVTLTAEHKGSPQVVCHRFACGPWVRSAQQAVQQLRAEGTLADDEQAYRLLVGLKAVRQEARQLTLPPLEPPTIVDQSLEELGIRSLGVGGLVPDRPVLISSRLVDDAIEQCVAAGSMETGGAVLGKIIRLPQPLPGAQTRVVTVLTAILSDRRHTGEQTRFHISPEALVEAAKVADLRGMGESVLSIFHTHGWGCGECNHKACPLAESYPSLQDYELQALFPSKALLLPIAGRKLGAAGRRPVLQIHAWRGGELKPVGWQQFVD